MFRTDDTADPEFTETLELDLSTVEPSLAGPRRPQDRVGSPNVWKSFTDVYGEQPEKRATVEFGRWTSEEGRQPMRRRARVERPRRHRCARAPQRLRRDRSDHELHEHLEPLGDVGGRPPGQEGGRAGPDVQAVGEDEHGTRLHESSPSTSTAPASIDDLEQLGFHVVGYGCTTCIGNSGPLPDPIAEAIDEHDLAVVSVLSGNRNFEGRIHPQVQGELSRIAAARRRLRAGRHGDIDLIERSARRGHRREPRLPEGPLAIAGGDRTRR